MSARDWDLLESFRVVGRLQHMSRAAEELGTSQPAVSRAMARLERRLGEPLFLRIGRTIRLTPKGRDFLKAVERCHEDLEAARAELFGGSTEGARPVALGFLRTLGVRIVPELVGRFKRRHPAVTLSFTQNNARGIEDDLDRGDVDLLLTTVPSGRASIASQWLFDQELVLIAPRRHVLATRKSVSLADTANEPFVTFKPGHAFRVLIEQSCRQAGFTPTVSFEGDDSSGIPGFVAAGFGVAIVPSDTPMPAGVVRLSTDGPIVRRAIGVAWSATRHLHANARLFRDALIEAHRADT
jgi:DNA-binding transcriptional LysR family regulator